MTQKSLNCVCLKKLPPLGQLFIVSLLGSSLLFTMAISDPPCLPFSICSHNDQWNEEKKKVIEASSVTVTYYFLANEFLPRMRFPLLTTAQTYFLLIIPVSFCRQHLWHQRKKTLVPPPGLPLCLFLHTTDGELLTVSLLCSLSCLLGLLTSSTTLSSSSLPLGLIFLLSTFIFLTLSTILPPNIWIPLIPWNVATSIPLNADILSAGYILFASLSSILSPLALRLSSFLILLLALFWLPYSSRAPGKEF